MQPAEFPLLIRSQSQPAPKLADFVEAEQSRLRTALTRHGAILLRGFAGADPGGLEAVAARLGGELMEYHDRAAHRSRISGRVFTSADYPPQYELFLHNEATYAVRFPTRLLFLCQRPADRGGETPIADVRAVLARLSRETLRAFAEKGVRYVRNFGTGLFGPSWQAAFQTDDPGQVDAYCRATGAEVEWLGPDRLRTSQTRPALLRHPETQECIWFNHAAALHVSTLDRRVRNRMTRLFKEDDYPSQTYYGDGGAIEAAVLDEIREAYRRETVPVEWEGGDVLLLDNLLVAHGRAAYKGRREVAVAMARPSSWAEADLVSPHELG